MSAVSDIWAPSSSHRVDGLTAPIGLVCESGVFDICESQAVGAADAHARGAGKGTQFPCRSRRSSTPRSAKAGRDHDRRSRPLAVALLYDT
jgi:hypothetical protein